MSNKSHYKFPQCINDSTNITSLLPKGVTYFRQFNDGTIVFYHRVDLTTPHTNYVYRIHLPVNITGLLSISSFFYDSGHPGEDPVICGTLEGNNCIYTSISSGGTVTSGLNVYLFRIEAKI